MLKSLIKIHLRGIFLQTAGKNDKQQMTLGRIIAMVALLIFIAATFGCMFGIVFYQTLQPFRLIGYEWLSFAIMALEIVLIGFIGSVFITQQEMYGAKDNELLLSMPIKSKDILLSRIFVILIVNYLYELLIAVPCIIVYFVNSPFDLLKLILFLLVLITLPLLTLTLSCVFGWFVAMFIRKVKNKTIITLLISLVFFGLYVYVINKFPEYITMLITNGKTIGEAVKSTIFPIYYLSIAISNNDIISMLIYLLMVFIPFIVVVYFLSKTFISITITKSASKKAKIKKGDIKHSSLKFALLKRELCHFTSNSMIMLNGALGVAFTVVLAGALLIKGPELIEIIDVVPPQLQGFINEMLAPLLCLGIISTNSINIISAFLISLEGKNLWILKALPVKTIDILNSKLYLHLIICIPPGILLSIVGGIVFSLSILEWIIVLITPMIFSVFVALLGLLINLWKPKFDWINETVVVKQSASVIITMLITISLIFFIIIGYFKLNSYNSMKVYFNSWLILFFVFDCVFYYLLKTWGVKKFEEL